jgi:hypothetical protein
MLNIVQFEDGSDSTVLSLTVDAFPGMYFLSDVWNGTLRIHRSNHTGQLSEFESDSTTVFVEFLGFHFSMRRTLGHHRTATLSKKISFAPSPYLVLNSAS